MTFETFSEQVKADNLIPRKCGHDHWQIRGGKFCVNFYPFKDGGPSFYVNGMNSGSRCHVTVADAIAAANKPPINKLHRRTRERKRSYKGAKRRLLRVAPFCYWCRKPLDSVSATLDHMIPLSKGGTNGSDNFALACKVCNQNRRNDMPERTKWSKNPLDIYSGIGYTPASSRESKMGIFAVIELANRVEAGTMSLTDAVKDHFAGGFVTPTGNSTAIREDWLSVCVDIITRYKGGDHDLSYRIHAPGKPDDVLLLAEAIVEDLHLEPFLGNMNKGGSAK